MRLGLQAATVTIDRATELIFQAKSQFLEHGDISHQIPQIRTSSGITTDSF